MSFLFSVLDYTMYDLLLHRIMQWVANSLVKLHPNLAFSSQWEHTIEIYCCYANTCGIQGNKLSTVSIVVNYLNCLNKDTMQHSAALWSTVYFSTLTRKLVSQQLQKDRKVTAHAYESPSPPSLPPSLLSSNFSSHHLSIFLSHLFTCSPSPHIRFSLLSPLLIPPSPSPACFFLPSLFLPPARSPPPLLLLQPPLLSLSCQVKPGHQAFEDLKVI